MGVRERWRVVALVTLASCADCTLQVLSGPAELIGIELPASGFSVSPDHFEVTAELVYTPITDWQFTDGSCPPRYIGEVGALANKIVVSEYPLTDFCSLERHLRSPDARQLAGWLIPLVTDPAYDPRPGVVKYMYNLGDSRCLECAPAADIGSVGAGPLVAALRDGATGIRVRVSPDWTAWDEARAHPLWWLVYLLQMVQALAVLELAGSRLHGFWTSERRVHFSLATVLLSIEIVCNVGRLLLFFDRYTFALYPSELANGLLAHTNALGSVTTALYLSYFLDACASAGVASLRLTSQSTIAFLCAFGLISLCAELLQHARFHTADRSVPLLLIANLYSFLALPLVLVVCSLVASFRVRRLVAEMPGGLVAALNRRLLTSVFTSVVTVCAGLSVLYSTVNPVRWALAGGLFYTSSMATSYVQVGAFKPIGGAALKHGPLRISWLWLARAMGSTGRSLASSTRSLGSSTRASLSRRLSSRYSRAQDATVRPVALDDGTELHAHLQLGVTLPALRAFSEGQGLSGARVSTAEVGARIAEISAPSGRSLCELLSETPTDELGAPVQSVGRATLFVSHAQACSWARLLDALGAHLRERGLAEEKTFLWLDLACIRQHQVTTEVRFIGAVQRRCQHVVMVLEPWHAPVCLTRVWCLYEVVNVFWAASEVQLHLALAPSEHAAFLHDLAHDRSRLESALASFDARNANATVEEDRERIFEHIAQVHAGGLRDDGIDDFNRSVREALHNAMRAYSWQIASGRDL